MALYIDQRFKGIKTLKTRTRNNLQPRPCMKSLGGDGDGGERGGGGGWCTVLKVSHESKKT